MKRSAPLTRKTPLARGDGLKRRAIADRKAETKRRKTPGFTASSIPAGSCICGCGRQRGVQLHHVVYQQELRRLVLAEHRASGAAGPPDLIREMTLLHDRRNLVPVGPKCHAAHHSRSKPLRLSMLPDAVFEFAAEVLGPDRAYEYLGRRYAGSDMRHERLLQRCTGERWAPETAMRQAA